jgi:triacylglycerol lipase
MSQRDYRYDRAKNPFDPAALAFTPNNALCLAAASSLVYESSDQSRAAELGQWGFTRHKFVNMMIKPKIDTQALVCSDPEVLLIAFRGTEATDLKDWLTNVQVDLIDGPIANADNKVHRGFKEALDAAWPQLEAAINDLRTQNQPIWITGHSLGAALATLAAARLSLGDGLKNQRLDVQGLYTFGQPRTGDRGFATAFDRRFAGRCFRLVNNNDIVTEVPPKDFLLRYWHVDRMIYIDADGKFRSGVTTFIKTLDRIRGLRRDFGKLGPDALKDHFMDNYIKAVRKYAEDVQTGKQAAVS